MFSKIFKKKDNDSKSSKKQQAGKITLLVIKSSHDGSNFYQLFSKCKLKDGRKIYIEQAGWDELQLTAYSDNLKPVVNLKPAIKPLPNTPQDRVRCIQPDFLLLRELCRGVRVTQDHRNLLYGFMISQTPSINSLHSMYCMNERAIMNSELIRLNRKYGQEKFPIFTQYYYPVHEEMLITPQYPIVLKLGHGHAGFGKIKLDNHKQFMDMKSIVATTDQYCTAENYIEGKHDLRLQKIGNNYQAYKRVSMSGNWKTNTGTSMIEHIEVQERYKWWMDECSKAFGGGFDICTVDVLVAEKDDKEYILEFNGTASGFGDQEKDNIILRDYVIEKLNEYFVDGDKSLNQPDYPNNDNLIKSGDIKDEEKYDATKYETKDNNDDEQEENDENDGDEDEDKDKDVGDGNKAEADGKVEKGKENEDEVEKEKGDDKPEDGAANDQ